MRRAAASTLRVETMASRRDILSADEFVDELRRHDARMRALAYSMLGSASAMDDVLQDSYLKAFRGIEQFRGEASFATWLGAIVYRSCLDHRRAAARRPVDPGGELGLREVADDRRPEAAVDARLDVMAALARLTPEHRAVLALVDLEGLSLAETAAVLGVPDGTAASRLARARAALRAAVGLDDDRLADAGLADAGSSDDHAPVERST